MQDDRQLLHGNLNCALRSRNRIAQRKGFLRSIIINTKAGGLRKTALLFRHTSAEDHALRPDKRQKRRKPHRAASEGRMQETAVMRDRHREQKRVKLLRQIVDMCRGCKPLRQCAEPVEAGNRNGMLLCKLCCRGDLPQIAARCIDMPNGETWVFAILINSAPGKARNIQTVIQQYLLQLIKEN